MEEKISGARIIAIADKRWKYILYASVCWALVFAGFFMFGQKERSWQFWMAEVVMTLFGSALVYMLLSPRYFFIGRSGEAYDRWMEEKTAALLQQDGRFQYVEDGFVFMADDGPVHIVWNLVSKIKVRLEDELSNDDDIVMRIELSDGHFIEFDEEINGWTKWESVLLQQYPSIRQDWMQEFLNSGLREKELFTS